ncbi:MAG: bifunctional riboflavin kinase/FAD synthetase [Solirubrobacterales bacterium]|nr:bifunctional riboflavin kinase/FAD synthetase [Solirubrobacterales bacterium]
MKVTRLPDVERRPRHLAVGTFDGVHLGHREVVASNDTVLTFDPHPLTVVAPGREPQLLTTFERKAELLAGLGVEELVVVPFTAEWSRHSAQSFLDEVIVGALGATHVSVGENFRFGHAAAGDADLLRHDHRFETRVVPLLEVDGEIVSSSHIRGLILGGAVEYADRLLGAPFQHAGPVVHGDKRGRDLGFPTANLLPHDGFIVPGHGVYACLANGVPAAVNVGVRPMFESARGLLIEAHLIDWKGDIYGEELKVDFLKRLRGERRFPSVDDLVEQMARDVTATLATVSNRQ